MLIYDRFEVFDLLEAFEDQSKFVTCQSTVIKEDTIHQFVVYKVASFCNTLTLAITQNVILQAKGLSVNFLKDRK